MPTSDHLIPPPDGTKEVLKANVYERSISLNAQLAPLFSYGGPGDMVVALVLQRGLPDKEYGLFYHSNTQEEVSLILASNMSRIPLGTMICSAKTHGVTTMFQDAHDPEAFMLMLIIQRQEDVNPGDQNEGFGLDCQNCQEPLLRATFSADPTAPERHGGRSSDRYPMFSTIWGSFDAAARFNADESLRTCGKCGQVNEPFPHETWGWHDWVAQNRVVNDAVAAMSAASAGRDLASAGASG